MSQNNAPQGMINTEGNLMQSGQNSLMQNLDGLFLSPMENNYNAGVNTDTGLFNQDLGNFQGLINSLNQGGGGGSINMGPGSGYSYFQNFANTGGFTPQQIQSIQQQDISPTRATFGNAMQNVQQQNNVQQFSPNYNATMANMTRNLAYGISNADVDANASIAQMVQQGQLAGAQGMAGLEEAQGQLGAENYATTLGGLINAMSGETGLYGATPGMASTFGNQLLGSGGLMLGGQESQNQIGSTLIGGQNTASGMGGANQQELGKDTSMLGDIGLLAAM
jgi:hypothetical protein